MNHFTKKNTFAGGGGSTGSGRTNGQGTNALFQAPTYVATDKSGFVYVAGYNDNSIRVITPGGLVSTLAGGGAAGGVVGNAVGVGTNALFNVPYGVSVDSLGNVYVGDQHNNIINKD